jgi:glutamate dehydrogenase
LTSPSYSPNQYKTFFEEDSFNHLLEKTEIAYPQIVMIRAYFKALKQMDMEESLNTVAQTFIDHPAFAKAFCQLFTVRFEPDLDNRDTLHKQTLSVCHQLLKAVTDHNALKILQKFLTVILATVRTNFYQKKDHDYLSFKFACQKIYFLPKPVPLYEIFVYSSKLEACHLRSSKVSRGGIRWSDRFQDFRYEVLSLMKTQTMKNSVIVPMGSKGGFVCKQYEALKNSGASKERLQQEGVDCYQTFMTALLGLTDNFYQGSILKPNRTVCYDEDDSYLVVAADKGTANFSDLANKIAADYNFWLGDAFASGGSKGFNHRQIGITSKGAWISVRRHFYELGIDCEVQPIITIGIGDMSGDVFGNGMLQSQTINLVAAFNHRYIFLDPSPDPLTAYAERQRLFNLPSSSWADYNLELVSTGGGVFSRSVSLIPLSPQVQSLLGINESIQHISSDELISLLLKAPVDLLWFGGIGTFVKSSHESHHEVHDTQNDTIRINANELKAKVIGEGANLGMTQKARIEYALRGGHLNTDAIDNSAGVSFSDHEVNLKLLFSFLQTKPLLSVEQRDILLHEVTSEIIDLILADNFKQTLILSLEGYALKTCHDIAQDLKNYQTVIHFLEQQPALHFDAELEGLPTAKEFLERCNKKQALTRPEQAVVMAYAKIYLYQQFLNSLKQTPMEFEFLELYYYHYFPKLLQTEFKNNLFLHPLKAEILATLLANQIVNIMGPCWCIQIAIQYQKTPSEIALEFFKVLKQSGYDKKWETLSQATFEIHPEQTYQKLLDLRKELESSITP